jgi:23S rRNA pseudouridine2605 synthase
MARPRKSTGGKTSFGKRTDAEKSFRDRKKSRPDGDERPRGRFTRSDNSASGSTRPSRFGGASKPSFGRKEEGSSDRPKRFSKPFASREGGEKGPFKKRYSDSFPPRAEGPPRFGKKPFQKRDDGSGSERPFKGRDSGPYNSGAERPSRFAKKPFERRDGNDKPFQKRDSRSIGSRDGSPPRFEKKPYPSEGRRKDEGGERPFKKREPSSFSRSEPSRFEKKPYPPEGRRKEEGDEKPFGKSEPASFDASSDKPPHFAKKPFEKRAEGEEKPFGKSATGFGKKILEKKDFIKKKKQDTDGSDSKSLAPQSESSEGIEKPTRKYAGMGGLPFKRKPFDKAKSVTSTRSVKTDKPPGDPDLIRLNKFIANSGVGSRREADELIKMGLVTVNGVTVTEMGHKVKLTDDVRYEGKRLKAEKPVYILLNKPKGFITTTDDPQERNTVMNLVANAGSARIYPVGRLDRNTTGLLLLTNDGDLADKLTHPSYNAKKIYKVELDKPIAKSDFVKIQEGVYLEEGRAMVDELAIVSDDKKEIGIELHIGWNRIVRRIFESLGYEVLKLDRVVYAGLDKKDIARGQWRFLKPEEVVMLKHFK